MRIKRVRMHLLPSTDHLRRLLTRGTLTIILRQLHLISLQGRIRFNFLCKLRQLYTLGCNHFLMLLNHGLMLLKFLGVLTRDLHTGLVALQTQVLSRLDIGRKRLVVALKHVRGND